MGRNADEAVLLKREDIQRILMVGEETARKLCKQAHDTGQPFPCLKIGSQYRIPEGPFLEYVSGKAK